MSRLTDEELLSLRDAFKDGGPLRQESSVIAEMAKELLKLRAEKDGVRRAAEEVKSLSARAVNLVESLEHVLEEVEKVAMTAAACDCALCAAVRVHAKTLDAIGKARGIATGRA